MTTLSLKEFGDKMLIYLPKLRREIDCYENRHILSGKITVPQMWALEFLSNCSPCSMKGIAQHMKINYSSATGLIDRLVKQGLVKRIQKKSDRRVVLIEITDWGAEIIDESYRNKREAFMKLFSRLSSGERYQYMTLIEKLVDSLSSVDKLEK